MTRHELIERAGKLKWFHAIDFGDCQSSGRFPVGSKQNITLFPVMALLGGIDFSGLTCYDVGTANGLSAFGMTLKGAARVIATDVGEMGQPFSLARELLGLNVEYVPHTSFDNILTRLPEHSADLMVCAGVMYHMLNPFDCILKARRLLKRDGLLVLETAFHSSDKGATLDFNAVSGRLKEVYSYWTPSESTVLGMLQLAGFNVIATRSMRKPDRLGVLARNVPLDELLAVSEMTAKLHRAGIYDPCFKGELPETPASTAKYHGPEDHVVLDWQVYEPDFAPHPRVMRNVLGSTTWRSVNRNF
jgi:2-polyprenyl-3-methyl-5-hydroxy-6-metoxy-1,4-benzoquinol methylase